ncbi:MAG: cupin domain-containing protein, partial [Methyloceanibacter sp.]
AKISGKGFGHACWPPSPACSLNQTRRTLGTPNDSVRPESALGLVQLGEHTDLSAGLLSKIERGKLIPTLPTLLKIALVFGVGLEHFFVDSRERPTLAVVRKKDRLRLPDRPGEESPSYFFESLDFPVTDRKMEAYYAEFKAHAKPMEPHKHAGAEVIYVITGQLVVTIDGDDKVLGEGDSLYFDSGFSHSYRQQGRAVCSAVVVVTP